MNYRFPTQFQILYLKGNRNGNTDRLDFRVENTWETELLVEIDGISYRLVKLVLVLCHIARGAGN